METPVQVSKIIRPPKLNLNAIAEDSSQEKIEKNNDEGFILPKRKRKRVGNENKSQAPTSDAKRTKWDQIIAPMLVSNKYTPLQAFVPTDDEPQLKIQPINVVLTKERTAQALGKLIDSTLSFRPVIYSKSNNVVAVHVATTKDFQALLKALPEEKFEFFLFRTPGDTPQVKIVVRGFHVSTSAGDIKVALEAEGLPVVNVAQMHAPGKEKVLYPLFLITLKEGAEAKKILNIKTLLYTKVTFEEYEKRKGPSQCYRCQRFQHVSRNCSAVPRCVKCGENHESKDCTSQGKTLSCANCGGDHTASYRGCPLFKNATRTYRNATGAKGAVNKNSSSTSRPRSEPKMRPSKPRPEDFPSLPTPKKVTYKPPVWAKPNVAPQTPKRSAARQARASNDVGTFDELLAILTKAGNLAQQVLSGSVSGSEASSQVAKLTIELLTASLNVAKHG